MKLNSNVRTCLCGSFFAVAFALPIAAGEKPATQSEPPAGVVSLFNGKDLSGWYAIQSQSSRSVNAMSREDREAAIATALKMTGEHWRVGNGEIVNAGQEPCLTTNQSFGDYELMIEYKTDARADSGVYLKGTPQVQIWDFTDESKFRIGADKGSGGCAITAPIRKGNIRLLKAINRLGNGTNSRLGRWEVTKSMTA